MFVFKNSLCKNLIFKIYNWCDYLIFYINKMRNRDQTKVRNGQNDIKILIWFKFIDYILKTIIHVIKCIVSKI